MQDRDGEAERQTRGETGKKLSSMMRDARVALGLSLEEVAAELRMEAPRLRALEECRFDELGPPVYAKGYLKQYGHRLGLNYDDLLAEYYRLVAPQDVRVAPVRTIKLRDERQITVWIIAALTIALLGVFLMVWWFDAPVRRPTEVVSPGADETEVLPPVPDIEPAPTEGAQEEAAPVVEEEAVVAAAGPDEVAPAPPPEEESAPPPPEEDSASPQELAVAAPSEITGPAISIDIVFIEDCWVEVTDARGASLVYGLGRAGTRSSVAAQAPVEVFLGNAAGVEMMVDGAPFGVPRRRGNLARFSIDGRTD